jgi:hypothetical protein
MSALPAYSGPRTPADDYALGHAACRRARVHAPTWHNPALDCAECSRTAQSILEATARQIREGQS